MNEKMHEWKNEQMKSQMHKELHTINACEGGSTSFPSANVFLDL